MFGAPAEAEHNSCCLQPRATHALPCISCCVQQLHALFHAGGVIRGVECCAQPSMWGANDGKGHSLVYYFGLPDGWEPSMEDNSAALALWQRFVHDGKEADG